MKYRQTVWLVALMAVATLDAAGSGVKLVDAVKQGNRAAVRTLELVYGTVGDAAETATDLEGVRVGIAVE